MNQPVTDGIHTISVNAATVESTSGRQMADLNHVVYGSDSALLSSAPLSFDPEDIFCEGDRIRLCESTLRAYASDWCDFSRWCANAGIASLPAAAETVADYLIAQCRVYSVHTLQRRLSTIAHVHRSCEVDSPTTSEHVITTWKEIKRRCNADAVARSAAVSVHLAAMVAALDDTVAGARTRAILLVAYAAALRPGEIIRLDRRDVTFAEEGLVLRIATKRDRPKGSSNEIRVPYGTDPNTCPVRALETWLGAGRITTGPVFRAVDRYDNVGERRLSPKAVAVIVKAAALKAGLDPARFTGQSIRSSLLLSADSAHSAGR